MAPNQSPSLATVKVSNFLSVIVLLKSRLFGIVPPCSQEGVFDKSALRQNEELSVDVGFNVSK